MCFCLRVHMYDRRGSFLKCPLGFQMYFVNVNQFNLLIPNFLFLIYYCLILYSSFSVFSFKSQLFKLTFLIYFVNLSSSIFYPLIYVICSSICFRILLFLSYPQNFLSKICVFLSCLVQFVSRGFRATKFQPGKCVSVLSVLKTSHFRT